MTAIRTNTRDLPRQNAKGQKLGEILIIVCTLLFICGVATMVLKKQAEQMLKEPTPQQEQAFNQEGTRRLIQTGMVEEYQKFSGERP